MGDAVKATPLPRGPFAAVVAVLVASSAISTMLFSFVAFMVDDFGVAATKEDVGYYAGYLASMYFVGTFAAGFLWGWVADAKGRRPALLCNVLGGLTTVACFGFSPAYGWAIAFRFIGGLLDATFSVAKAYVSDITDRSNRAQGFSLINMAFGVGSMIGPALGGFFSQAALKYPQYFAGTIFERFPYALPCLLCAGMNFTAFVLCFFYLPETRGTKSTLAALVPHQSAAVASPVAAAATASEVAVAEGDHGDPLDVEMGGVEVIGEESKEHEGYDAPARTMSTATSTTHSSSVAAPEVAVADATIDVAETDLETDLETEAHDAGLVRHASPMGSSDAGSRPGTAASHAGTTATAAATPAGLSAPAMNSSKDIIKLIFTDPTLFRIVLMYWILSFTYASAAEGAAIWAMADRQYGGLNFGTDSIGVIFMFSGAFSMAFQGYFYHRWVRRVGIMRSMKIGYLIAAAGLFIMPQAAIFESPVLVWGIMLTATLLRVIGVSGGFTAVNVLMNLAAPQNTGKVNGIAFSFAGMTKAGGPAFAGNMIAWSMGNGLGFPLNYELLWLLLAGSLVVCYVISLRLIDLEEVEREREREKEEAEAAK